MQIIIKRRYLTKSCVIGSLKIYDTFLKNDIQTDEIPLFSCLTLEEDKEGVEANKDLRVPEGEYKLKRHSPSSFESTLQSITKDKNQKMLCLYNEKVPASRCILIHWGNNDKDTKGCILLGYTRLDNESIGQSRLACSDFYKFMKELDLEEVRVKIINEF